MAQYLVEPEVPGSFGDKTQGDFSKHPPVIEHLHFQFEGWLGDDLLESFLCFLVSKDLGRALLASELTGFTLQNVEVSVSATFIELYPNLVLPDFFWLKVSGMRDVDDISLNDGGVLLCSETAMSIMRAFNLKSADVVVV